MIEFVLAISTLLQFLAAGMALRLIWVTRYRAAWLLIASAMFLMAIRRSITLSRILFSDTTSHGDIAAELVALLISILMVSGITLIHSYFREVILANEESRNREERYRQVPEASNAAIAQFDTDGICLFSNTRAAAVMGMTPAEMIGKTLWDLEPHDVADERLKLIRRVAETGRGEESETYNEGMERHFMRSVQPVCDTQGKNIGAQVFMHDVTAYKHAQSEAARFGRVLDESLNEIYIIDSETLQFISVNHGARTNLGYSAEELCNLSPVDIKPEYTTEQYAELTELLREGKQASLEFTTVHRRKDGTEYPVEARLQLSTEDAPAFIEMVVDITERVRAEEAQAEARLVVRRSQKLEAIGTLAGGVAHEINNPITGIMNYAQLIGERLEPESPLREFAAGIYSESERVAEIVRNLLAFARQDKESHSLANIADIVNDTVSLVRTIIRRDQITLNTDVPDDLPKIKCRSRQIQQVLMNLLTNARDALNQRYPEHDPDKIMKVVVRPFERNDRRWLRVTVEDHGLGISKEVRERVFDPFFTTKDRAQGTGLGLSISHGIIQDHHGELRVESELGRNTRFQVELPVDNEWTLGDTSA